jgi:hypothetical protein
MIHYDLVKKLAKQIGRPVKDLLAMPPGNDPFYAGVPFRLRDAEWFANLWQGYGFPSGVHLRRIHYVLVSKEGEVRKPDGTPYENTQGDWQYLGRASNPSGKPRRSPWSPQPTAAPLGTPTAATALSGLLPGLENRPTTSSSPAWCSTCPTKPPPP